MEYVIAAIIAIIIGVAGNEHAKRKMEKQMAERGGFMVTRYGTDEELPVLLGEGEVAPVVVYKASRDMANKDVPNETLWLILVWGVTESRIEAIDEFWLDDIKHQATQWLGNRELPQPAGRKLYEVGWDEGMIYYDGVKDQQNPFTHAMGDEKGVPPWFLVDNPDADRLAGFNGRGLVRTFIRLHAHDKDKYWPNGEPKLRVRFRGERMWDPRDPAQAPTDPTTWRYSTNLPLAILHLARSAKLGGAFPLPRIDVTSFEQAATLSEAQVSTPDGFRPMMAVSAVLSTGRGVRENLDTLRAGCRGWLTDYGGPLRLTIETSSDPVLTLDESDYRELNTTGLSPDDRFNQVIVRYADENQRFEMSEVIYPEPDSAEDLAALAEDGGIRRTHEADYQTIGSWYEARQMAEVIYRLSRDGEMGTLMGLPHLQCLQPGDVIAITNQTRGWVAKPFRVQTITPQESGAVKLSILEHQDNAYPWGDKPQAPSYPDTVLPRPWEVEPVTNLTVALTPTAAQAQGAVSWDAPVSAYLDHYQLQLLLDGVVIHTQDMIRDTRYTLRSLDAGSYTVQVVAVTRIGAHSAAATVSFDLALPAPPSLAGKAVQSGNTYVLLYPTLATLNHQTEFEFAFRGTDPAGVRVIRGRGRSYQMEGLAPATEYHLSVRTVNPLGESAWVDVAATTTRDNTVINDILDLPPDTSVGDTLAQFDRDIGLGSWESLKGAMEGFNTTQDTVEQAKTQATLLKGQQLQAEGQEAIAAQIEALQAQTEQAEALIAELKRAGVYERQVIAEQGTTLTARIGEAQAASEAYTRAAMGYWVDAQGNIVQPGDPAAATFVDGPLAEFVRHLEALTADGGQASLSQLMQVFQTEEGGLVARGSMMSDVNGFLNGYVGVNDGVRRTLDFVTRLFRIGDVDQHGNFIPLLYFDTATGKLVVRGQLILGDGYTVDDVASIRGQDGTPGVGFYQLTLRGGQFPADATATQDFTDHFDRAPRDGDHLTYTSADNATASTKRFNGSAWQAPGAIINRNMLVRGIISGDYIEAGTRLSSPVIEGGEYRTIGPATMKVERETPFGPDNLVEWRGPKLLINGEPDWANLKKSNASRWTDANGAEYFGGTLSAGVYHNAVETTVKTLYNVGGIPVHLGPFSTRGRSKTVVVSFAYSASSSRSEHPGSLTTKHLTYQLQRRTASSNWVTLKSETVQWQVGVAWDSEFNHYWIDEMARHSTTFTDTNSSTEDFEYRVQVTSHDRFHTSTHVSTQELSIVSTEQ